MCASASGTRQSGGEVGRQTRSRAGSSSRAKQARSSAVRSAPDYFMTLGQASGIELSNHPTIFVLTAL
jgi:hypothetical protein